MKKQPIYLALVTVGLLSLAVGRAHAQLPLGADAGLARPSRAKRFTNQVGIKMVWIPPGEFMMGSDNADADTDEKLAHHVKLTGGFYIGRFEVTQGEWQKVIGTDLRAQRQKVNSSGLLKGESDKYPMYYVGWSDAQEFVQKLNQLNDGYFYRLPTEAEWEYACRAGTTGDYAGKLDALAWYANNSGEGYIDFEEIVRIDPDEKNYAKRQEENGNVSHPVGTKKPNGWGLYDMHGNVFEWVQDIYHDSYRGAPIDGTAWLAEGRRCFGGSYCRVLRGGSWVGRAIGVRSTSRTPAGPDVRSYNKGFRVVAVARTQ